MSKNKNFNYNDKIFLKFIIILKSIDECISLTCNSYNESNLLILV